MQPNDFSDERSGRLIKMPQGYWAFVPNPLPPPVELSWELAMALSEADRALSELAGAAGTLPNPHLLIRPFVRREAVLSSRIEGTQASLSDLFFFEASGASGAHPQDVLEVANYAHALEYGIQRMNELPISGRLLREIHERLMANVRGSHLTPGEFRRSQNWIGAPGCTLDQASYVPPPVEEMHKALGDLENYLHAPSTLPPLIRIAAIHYQFEAIHPFLDGNGRIGRLLITLLLCAESLLPQPLLYVSAFFERNRAEYYRFLMEVSQYGRWNAWIHFFLRAVTVQSRDALLRAKTLLGLQEEFRRLLLTNRATTTAVQLSDHLFTTPVLTIPQAAEYLHVSYRTAQLAIEKLVQLQIVVEATGRTRNKAYASSRIIDVVEAAERDEAS